MPHRTIRRITLVAAVTSLSACVGLSPPESRFSAACPALVNESQTVSLHGIDPTGFSLLNWNIQKARDPAWYDALDAAGGDIDLVLLQEAAPRFRAGSAAGDSRRIAFAEGFGIGKAKTGVMTIGSASPDAECGFNTPEPIFRTRKAMLVTTYPMLGSSERLMVVNLHGVNFSLGLESLERQFAQAAELLSKHSGPAILSGDFNTWRRGRYELLDRYVDVLDMNAVEFDNDVRKRFFGWPLDHVFVRGLDVTVAETWNTDSSDHNPMWVELRVSVPEG